VVESTALEMRHTRKGIVGSNPTLSARLQMPEEAFSTTQTMEEASSFLGVVKANQPVNHFL
jgi:hypothetical protein